MFCQTTCIDFEPWLAAILQMILLKWTEVQHTIDCCSTLPLHLIVLTAWWWIGVLVSSLCFLYIFLDYLLDKDSRRSPSMLMMSRAVFDFIAVLLVFVAIESSRVSCDETRNDPRICKFWGGSFLFSLYVPAIYYSQINWQLYRTLKNPFLSPRGSSLSFHVAVLAVCSAIVAFVANVPDGEGQFEYRPSFQICFMKSRAGINGWNVAVIYIPYASESDLSDLRCAPLF